MTIIGLAVVWDDGAVVFAATGWSRRRLRPMITKQQYRKLMNEYQATGNVTNSALKAAMSRPTARKYVTAAQPAPAAPEVAEVAQSPEASVKTSITTIVGF